jgi:hypothetical protein
MAECRICGTAIREGDDVVKAQGVDVHAGCVEPPKPPRRRRLGRWAGFGSRGQMAIGDVQRDSEG